MDQILLGLGAAGATLLVVAIAVALWEHRRHLAELRQQLAWSKNTRDLLQAHARDVDARLDTLSAAVNAKLLPAPAALPQPLAGKPSQGQAASRTTAHAGSAAVALAAAQAAVRQHWIDTEPMVLTSQVLEGSTPDRDVPDFDPTMPAELSEH